MTNRPDGLFELPAGSGEPAFEEDGLPCRTDFQSRAARSGADFKGMALARLREAGARIERVDFDIEGFPVDALIAGGNRRRFLVLARGTPEEQQFSGLRRTDTVQKVGYVAMQLARRQRLPIVLFTSDLPDVSTKTARYLAALSEDVWDVVAYRADLRGFQRLCGHLAGPVDAEAPLAPWRTLASRTQPALPGGAAPQA